MTSVRSIHTCKYTWLWGLRSQIELTSGLPRICDLFPRLSLSRRSEKRGLANQIALIGPHSRQKSLSNSAKTSLCPEPGTQLFQPARRTRRSSTSTAFCRPSLARLTRMSVDLQAVHRALRVLESANDLESYANTTTHADLRHDPLAVSYVPNSKL